MSYSQGIARFLELVAAPPAEPDQTAFLAPLCPAGGSVLDIGAGVGRTAFALAERGVNVIALEPDAEMYSVLLSRLASRPELHARITPVPKPAGYALDRTFDCVLSAGSIAEWNSTVDSPSLRAATSSVGLAMRALATGWQAGLRISRRVRSAHLVDRLSIQRRPEEPMGVPPASDMLPGVRQEIGSLVRPQQVHDGEAVAIRRARL